MHPLFLSTRLIKISAEGCQISVTSAAGISSVLESVDGAGLVAGPAGGVGLETVLASEGGEVKGGK